MLSTLIGQPASSTSVVLRSRFASTAAILLDRHWSFSRWRLFLIVLQPLADRVLNSFLCLWKLSERADEKVTEIRPLLVLSQPSRPSSSFSRRRSPLPLRLRIY